MDDEPTAIYFLLVLAAAAAAVRAPVRFHLPELYALNASGEVRGVAVVVAGALSYRQRLPLLRQNLATKVRHGSRRHWPQVGTYPCRRLGESSCARGMSWNLGAKGVCPNLSF